MPPPPNFYVDVLTPDVTVLGNKAFKEVIKVKQGFKSRQDWCSYKKRKKHQRSLALYKSIQRKNAVKTQQEASHKQAGRKVSSDTHTAGTLILDF